MSANNRSPVIATFTKNSREEVRLSVEDYRGHTLMNLRVHNTYGAGGDYAKVKGLSLRVELYQTLLDAILEVGEHLKREGLLPATEAPKRKPRELRRRFGDPELN